MPPKSFAGQWALIGDCAVSHHKGWTLKATTMSGEEFMQRYETEYIESEERRRFEDGEARDWREWMVFGTYAIEVTRIGLDEKTACYMPPIELHSSTDLDLFRFMTHADPASFVHDD